MIQNTTKNYPSDFLVNFLILSTLLMLILITVYPVTNSDTGKYFGVAFLILLSAKYGIPIIKGIQN